ncbi:MAG: M60 family metallopeptidase [Planctomycetota bacterium]|nr:M60 family metallopeptidase [Planctomycetota bacterium]
MLISLLVSLALCAQSHDADRTEIIGGVTQVAAPGTPGLMAVYGENAFVVFSAGKLGKEVPVAAAARYGKGRVFGIAHSGYFSFADRSTATGEFMMNAREWLGDNDSLEVKEFNTLGIRSKQQADELRQWVYDGGALLLAECPWGWEQVTSKDMREELPSNWVMAPMGLCFASGYAATNTGGNYAMAKSLPHAANAGEAARRLMNARGKELSAAGMFALNSAVAAVPRDDEILRPLLAEYFKSQKGRAPLKRKPIKSADVSARLWVSLYSAFWKELPAEEVTAALGVDEFPGVVAATAPRVNATVKNDGTLPGWNSTGYYINAGEVLTLTLVEGDAAHWRVRVGCHKDTLWHLDSWKRWPEITIEKGIAFDENGEMKVATPWGGSIYLIPTGEAKKIALQLSGVVAQPYFVASDEKSDSAWRKSNKSAAPWAELVGRNVIISIPTASLKKIKDPRSVTDYWDALLASHCDLAGIPMLRRPERFVGDQQISAGYMHSGYPVMTWMDVVTPSNGRLAPILDLQLLRKQGNWGYFHELGHNRQRGWWTFGGTGEVTNNLFSLHGGEVMAGIEPWENKWLQGQKKGAAKYLKDGADWSKWKKSPGIALVSFAMIQREFGWQPFQTFFSDYEKVAARKRPKNDQQEIDGWVLRLSLILQLDMRDYFQQWGWPLSDAVLVNDELDALKTWSADFSWAK